MLVLGLVLVLVLGPGLVLGLVLGLGIGLGSGLVLGLGSPEVWTGAVGCGVDEHGVGELAKAVEVLSFKEAAADVA